MSEGEEDAWEPDGLLVEGALSTLGIGAWRYEPQGDRFTCDERTARLFGLTPAQRRAGVPIARVAEAVHPDDRERYHARRSLSLRYGGGFSLAYRTVPGQGAEHRVLAHGLYRRDAAGRLVEARGVVIDVGAGADDLGSHMVEAAALDRVGALPMIDRVARHAVEVHRAVHEEATLEARLLRPAADELLAEVLRVLALAVPTLGH